MPRRPKTPPDLESVKSEARDTLAAVPFLKPDDIEFLAEQRTRIESFRREAVRAERAKTAAEARAAKGWDQEDTKTDALRRAGEIRRKEPGLSVRAIARRLEGEVGVPFETIRGWLKPNK